jgi:DNA-binding FadR family transcriptional regulator
MLHYFGSRQALVAPVLDASAHAHARIADAVIAGNAGLASHRMATHLRAEADFIRSGRGARQALRPTVAFGVGTAKGAEAVARSVFADVMAEGLAPGDLIGSEPDLVARYGVSRAVWREGVRILEHHHVAVMRRGPAGGLYVEAPSAAAVSDVVAVYLERHQTRVEDLMEVRLGVEAAVVDLVIQRAQPKTEADLRAVLHAEQAVPGAELSETAHGLHNQLAALSGNRVLELLARILIRLTRMHEMEHAPREMRRAARAGVGRAHSAVVDAIVARDRELARHRLKRHLEALVDYLD